MVDPARAEPLLGDQEAFAAATEQVLGRDADILIAHVAVRRPAAAAVAQHGHGLDRHARRIRRDDDLAHPLVRRLVRLGHRHHDPERRALRAAREPLAAVDHPLVAVEPRGRLQAGRVGARDVGLGHREERARVAVDERLQPPLLLLVRAEEVEDLAVARVGRLAPEDQLRDEAPPDLLVEVRVLDEAAAAAARLRRQVRRPEACVLRLLAQLGDQPVGGLVLGDQPLLVRIDVLLHERPHALAPLGDQVRDDSGHGLRR